MNSSAFHKTRALAPRSTTTHRAGPGVARPASSSIEREANAAATDWQIILQLKALFERQPELIASLARETDGIQSDALLSTLLAAAREALAAHPDSADLHFQIARLNMRIGGVQQAEAQAQHALELNPYHVDALLLLVDICTESNQPQRAIAYLQHARAAGVVLTGTPYSEHSDGERK